MKLNSIPTSLGVPLAAGLAFAACGGAQKPEAQMADAEASIRAARELGAEQDPQAALYLKFALENQEAAHKLIKDDEYEPATRRLEMAKADAELALSMAKAKQATADAKAQVHDAREQTQDITEETREQQGGRP